MACTGQCRDARAVAARCARSAKRWESMADGKSHDAFLEYENANRAASIPAYSSLSLPSLPSSPDPDTSPILALVRQAYGYSKHCSLFVQFASLSLIPENNPLQDAFPRF